MDIKNILAVINSSLPEEHKRLAILGLIAADEEAIPDLLEILNHERTMKKELITDSNMELSRALIALEDPNIGKLKPAPIIDRLFVVKEIMNHYIKWKDYIRCNFKIKGLP